MKNFLFLLCFALLTAISAPVAAQRAPDARILVVDFRRVFEESEVGKNMIAQLQSYEVDVQRRERDLAEQLEQREQELQARRDVLAPEALREQFADYERNRLLAQREIRGLLEQGQTALAQAQKKVEQFSRPIVLAIMEDRKATMVLPKQVVQHHVSGLDVTTQVIEKLNNEISSFELALPGRAEASNGG